MVKKTKSLLLGLTLILFTLTGSLVWADEDTVLMFVRDGSRDLELMLQDEVLVMKNMLESEGYTVKIATSDGSDLSAGSVRVAVDYKIADVSMDDYSAIALPCMAPAPGTALEQKVVDLVRAAAADNKPIAASRGSVAFVAEAGALKEKRFAFASAARLEPLAGFSEGTFVGTGTETDGLLSTTGICPLAARSLNEPDGTADLTRSFIQTLKSRS